jgi:hypothetical protein
VPEAPKTFEIDDTKTFDQNVDAYGDALVAIDPTLGAALKAQLKDLITKKKSPAEIWDALLAATEKAEHQLPPANGGAKA